MLGIDAQFSIISYAVVSAKYESRKNLIVSFLPLVEHVLLQIEEKSIKRKEILSVFKETYGYEIPPAILYELLKILEKNKKIEFLVAEEIEILKEKLEDYETKELHERALRALVSDFDIFMKKRGKALERSKIVNLILSFIVKNAIEFNDYLTYNSDFEKIEDDKEYQMDIVEFLIEERRNNTRNYEFIKEIYFGVIISSMICSVGEGNGSNIEEDVIIENVLLDSNYIFRLIDLQTEFEHISAKDIYDNLKKTGCKFWVMKHTIKQIAKTISNFMNEYSPSTNSVIKLYGEKRFSGISSACLRRNLTSSDLKILIDNIEQELTKKFGVEVIDDEQDVESRIKDEDIASLGNVKPDSLEEGLVHDLLLIYTVREKRSKNVYSMSNAKWWVLTDDYKLARWNSQNLSDSKVPESITEVQVATVLWMSNSQNVTVDGLFNSVLAFKNRSLINSEDYLAISKNITKQFERYKDSPEKLNKLSLVFSDKMIDISDLATLPETDVSIKIDQSMETASNLTNELQELRKKNKELESTNIELADDNERVREEKEKELSQNQSLLSKETLEHIETLKQSYDDKEKNLKGKEKDLRKTIKVKNISIILTKILLLTIVFAIIVTVICIFISKLNKWVEDNPVWATIIFASIGSPIAIVLFIWKRLDKIIVKTWPSKTYFKKQKNTENELKQLSNELNDLQEKIDAKSKILT